MARIRLARARWKSNRTPAINTSRAWRPSTFFNKPSARPRKPRAPSAYWRARQPRSATSCRPSARPSKCRPVA
eukprot:8822903-Lingulodinium_polyedra.AAC.1